MRRDEKNDGTIEWFAMRRDETRKTMEQLSGLETRRDEKNDTIDQDEGTLKPQKGRAHQGCLEKVITFTRYDEVTRNTKPISSVRNTSPLALASRHKQNVTY